MDVPSGKLEGHPLGQFSHGRTLKGSLGDTLQEDSAPMDGPSEGTTVPSQGWGSPYLTPSLSLSLGWRVK